MIENPEKTHTLSAHWAVREVDHLLSRFARTTRFVLYGKWSLTILALLLMVVLIAWPYFTRDATGVRVSFINSSSIKSDTTLLPRMNNPKYEATTNAGEPFKVTGKVAIQKSATLVVIENVNAELLKSDGSWLSLSADSAEYDQTKGNIILKGNVNVVNDKGYNFVTPSASVDMKTMHVVGNESIAGVGPQGKLLASNFEITDNGKQVHFGGKSRIKIEIQR
jgi:lipopolysaccharide export system protein LptC